MMRATGSIQPCAKGLTTEPGRRQHGGEVIALELKSGSPNFKYHPECRLDFLSVRSRGEIFDHVCNTANFIMEGGKIVI